MSEKLRQYILVLGDVGLLYLALWLALSIRYRTLADEPVWQANWPTFSLIFLLWVAAFFIVGLYTLSNIRNDLKFYITTTQIMAVNILLAVAIFYVIPYFNIAPKTILVLTGLIYFALFVLWRRLAHHWISLSTLKRQVLIIGNNQTVRELVLILDQNPQYGYSIAAILDHNPSDKIGNIADYRDASQLAAIITKHRIDTIVLDNTSRTSQALINNLFGYLPAGIEFLELNYFYEMITKKVSLETIDKFWFLDNMRFGSRRLFDIGKRTFDILAACGALIIALGLSPFIIIISYLANGRPIFFRQIRSGTGGQPFLAIKFRTMVRNAEKNGAQWARPNDPRVTRFGRWLRKTRLDEIPQLINILMGDMSFVGPRPERPEFVSELEKTIPFYRERLLVKPGLTGWAQINYSYGASVGDATKKLQYDLYYIKNRSFVLDVTIILRTIKTVLAGMGR